eukprot:154959-Pleurochrysis_carterae.AAC.5
MIQYLLRVGDTLTWHKFEPRSLRAEVPGTTCIVRIPYGYEYRVPYGQLAGASRSHVVPSPFCAAQTQRSAAGVQPRHETGARRRAQRLICLRGEAGTVDSRLPQNAGCAGRDCASYYSAVGIALLLHLRAGSIVEAGAKTLVVTPAAAASTVELLHTLADRSAAWTERDEALKEIAELADCGEIDQQIVQRVLLSVAKQLPDLRSQVVRSACIALQALTAAHGWNKIAQRTIKEAVVPQLLTLAGNGNTVLASAGRECLPELLKNTASEGILKLLTESLTSATQKSIRHLCGVSVLVALQEWPEEVRQRLAFALVRALLRPHVPCSHCLSRFPTYFTTSLISHSHLFLNIAYLAPPLVLQLLTSSSRFLEPALLAASADASSEVCYHDTDLLRQFLCWHCFGTDKMGLCACSRGRTRSNLVAKGIGVCGPRWET